MCVPLVRARQKRLPSRHRGRRATGWEAGAIAFTSGYRTRLTSPSATSRSCARWPPTAAVNCRAGAAATAMRRQHRDSAHVRPPCVGEKEAVGPLRSPRDRAIVLVRAHLSGSPPQSKACGPAATDACTRAREMSARREQSVGEDASPCERPVGATRLLASKVLASGLVADETTGCSLAAPVARLVP